MRNKKKSLTRIRVMSLVVEAIRENGRPITVHEYEDWLQHNHRDLWMEIIKKCHDYTRIIVTSKEAVGVDKYICLDVMPNIDPRSIFFGAKGDKYDKMLWLKAEEFGMKNKSMAMTDNLSNDDDDSYFPRFYESDLLSVEDKKCNEKLAEIEIQEPTDKEKHKQIIISMNPHFVESETSELCWKELRNNLPLNDPFWLDLYNALAKIQDYVRRGFCAQDIVTFIMSKYESLNKDRVVHDSTVIIFNHIHQIQQTSSTNEQK